MRLALWLLGALATLPTLALASEPIRFEYKKGSVSNPLKGLVPYASSKKHEFPHTMEFTYIGLAEIAKGYEEFDWRPLEEKLNAIAARGHHAIFRIYMEYPGKKDGIPSFLVRDGLKVHRYLNTNTQPFPPAEIETPDYEDENLRRLLKNFIQALGAKYDGDPRIGFITAGLLGTWGEWHTHPRNELFASKTVQAEVMDSFESAFHTTPILLRYPVGDRSESKASNVDRPLGYHDDSFAWATLDTGKKQDSWFFLPSLKSAGDRAISKWKMHPIGGEIRPEAWGAVFDENPSDERIQNFRECVEQTHVSWLMDSGMFGAKQNNAVRVQRAKELVQAMGYDFFASQLQVSHESHRLSIQLTVENRGVAPFYYPWKPEYALLRNSKVVHTWTSQATVQRVLPSSPAVLWEDSFDTASIAPGKYILAVRIPNTLPNGSPIRFANATQDIDLDGWLSLTTLEW